MGEGRGMVGEEDPTHEAVANQPSFDECVAIAFRKWGNQPIAKMDPYDFRENLEAYLSGSLWYIPQRD